MSGRWIVVDIDGTLAEDNHRAKYALVGNWAKFHAELDNSNVIAATDAVLQAMQYDYKIMLLTTNYEANRRQVIRWLVDHGQDWAYQVLLMRPEGNMLPSEILKLAMLEDYFGGKREVLHNVLFALEDRDHVVTAMREYGLTVHQVRTGKY